MPTRDTLPALPDRRLLDSHWIPALNLKFSPIPNLNVDVLSSPQVSSIESTLNKLWESFDGPNPDFWAHEYEKHGTCAEQVPALSTELKFFQGTLALAQKYELVSMLSTQGIKPGQQTSATAFGA
jgi:hypothetical protein